MAVSQCGLINTGFEGFLGGGEWDQGKPQRHQPRCRASNWILDVGISRKRVGRDSSVGIAGPYGLESPRIGTQ